ncbi:hypothetical protein [Shouchella clausii]|uniref:hypothetical protein n=1 Tax=Shouchella clausii TaxID=79880 RepID=UPI001C7392E7|nr:hypothetical protein [Shouchella clausii]MBX0320148.1 hypothetical protein [Shouchella clausii]MEB5480838.1 hypothetical protein [Shouchella clausii]
MVRTRKNKNYTSILLDEMSIEAFKEAKKVYDSINGAKVIKPTKKALQAFVKLHSVTLDTVETGGEYKILGTVFKVIRNLDYQRKESNEWFPIVRYYDRTKNRYEEFGIVSTNNFALGVHEHCFQNMTNTLLYY